MRLHGFVELHSTWSACADAESLQWFSMHAATHLVDRGASSLVIATNDEMPSQTILGQE